MDSEVILQKFSEKLGSEDFISPGKLVRAGLFGSSASVRNALKRGIFPSLKISSHRTLIHRESVLKYIRKNFDFASEQETRL